MQRLIGDRLTKILIEKYSFTFHILLFIFILIFWFLFHLGRHMKLRSYYSYKITVLILRLQIIYNIRFFYIICCPKRVPGYQIIIKVQLTKQKQWVNVMVVEITWCILNLSYIIFRKNNSFMLKLIKIYVYVCLWGLKHFF